MHNENFHCKLLEGKQINSSSDSSGGDLSCSEKFRLIEKNKQKKPQQIMFKNKVLGCCPNAVSGPEFTKPQRHSQG